MTEETGTLRHGSAPVFNCVSCLLTVEGRVGEIDIFLVHLFLGQTNGLTEAINLSKSHQTLVPQGKNRDMEGASARSISCQERGSEGIYIGL